MKNNFCSARGQISLEALLLWAGLAAMLALLVPALAGVMEAQELLLSVREFESFASRMDTALMQAAFSSPGTRFSIPVPQMEGLSVEILEQTLFLDFDNVHFSSRKTREFHSPLSLEGSPSFPARIWIISRVERGILIQSQS